MEERRIANWEDFEREIGEIFCGYEKRCRKLPSLRLSPPLFGAKGTHAGQWRQFRDRLSLMNINAYTLFGNEEGLMETLAYEAVLAKSLCRPKRQRGK